MNEEWAKKGFADFQAYKRDIINNECKLYKITSLTKTDRFLLLCDDDQSYGLGISHNIEEALDSWCDVTDCTLIKIIKKYEVDCLDCLEAIISSDNDDDIEIIILINEVRTMFYNNYE